VDYAISADGNAIAFTTQRTQFSLGSPTFVSEVAPVPGMVEAFYVDLENETLTRVTHGYTGEDERSEQFPHSNIPSKDPYEAYDGAFSPSLSEDGAKLAFASSASNLVYGDGNDEPDVFVVQRTQPPSGVVEQQISPVPAGPALLAPWKLGLTASSLPNGGVRLYAEVPALGSLSAKASGQLLVEHRAHTKRGGAHHASVGHETTTLRTSTVAATHALATASDGGLVALTLTLSHKYSALAARGSGYPATVTVTLDVPGHAPLHASIDVRFHRTVHKAKAKASRSRRRAPLLGAKGSSR
jgi:hypothetical protein